MISPLAFLEGVGSGEMIGVFILALLLFGGDKLPGLAKGMGKAIREFKKAASDVEHEIKRAIDEAPETATPKPPTTFPPYPTPAASAVAFPPLTATADPEAAFPYSPENDQPSAQATAPAPAEPAQSEPELPGDKPPAPPAPTSPYEHLNDL